ncbi:hypothetical protein RQP46_008039 [Phenoliferia psychrophenolica]
MATIHSLAPEFLIDIFELAHDPRRPSTMCAASLVCRAWRDPAQRTLFLDIVVVLPTEHRLNKNTSKLLPLSLSQSPRLYPPRRVEVLASSTKSIDANGELFQGLAGVKDLVITGGYVSPGFLSDLNLQATVRDLSVILTVPNNIDEALSFFNSVQNLHRLTFNFENVPIEKYYSLPHALGSFLEALVGSLPSSIERLELKNIGGPGNSLLQTPFNNILELFAGDRLPNLTRIDFPDCKRRDLEDEVAAADLLGECERKLIRVVCWEEFI